MKRRHFIRGLGSTLVYLPVFDFMLNSNGTAFAQSGEALPSKMLLMRNGLSIGRGRLPEDIVPNRMGRNYDLKKALLPLGTFQGLQDYVSVVSNLMIPYSPANGNGNIPAAGLKNTKFHNVMNEIQVTGMREGRSGPSADQIVRQTLDPGSNYAHLNLCVQASSYQGNDDSARGISQFDNNGNRLSATRNPRTVFRQLFSGAPSVNPEQERQRLQALAKKKSILDLIDRDETRKIAGKSKQAGVAMDQYLTEVRSLEQNIDRLMNSGEAGGQSCTVPDQPDDIAVNLNTEYSNEKLRAQVMNQMIVMAMNCNLVRFGTYRITYDQSNLNVREWTNSNMEYHELTHKSPLNENLSYLMDLYAWHMEVYGDLINRLKNIEHGAGNLLDNSAIVMTSEGGTGVSINDGRTASPHSTENMVSLIAGKAGGLTGGLHVDGNKEHPSKVLISAMKAAGVNEEKLGEVNGVIQGLF